MNYDPNHKYDPENPGEGVIPAADQLRIAASGAYLLTGVFGFFTVVLLGLALFVMLYCHSAFGLLFLLPGLPMAWATFQGFVTADEISRGDL